MRDKLTIGLALWAAAGPMAGVLVGHFLTRSWQREQWHMDQRRQEYRELLTAITNAYMALIRSDYGDESNFIRFTLEVAAVRDESFRTLRDRIYIAGEIANADILGQWDTAVTNYEYDKKEERRFAERFTNINNQLIFLALHPRKRPSRSRVWRDRRAVAKFRAAQSDL
jgi:hypothetical protein